MWFLTRLTLAELRSFILFTLPAKKTCFNGVLLPQRYYFLLPTGYFCVPLENFMFWWVRQQSFFITMSSWVRRQHAFSLFLCSFLKLHYYSSIGFFLPFKKSFFLSGRVNRITLVKKRCLKLKLGFSSDVSIFAPRGVLFKSFKLKHSVRVIASRLCLLTNFIYLLRHLRFRGTYTGRGIRIYRELFKPKKRPDFGKFGVKMSFY